VVFSSPIFVFLFLPLGLLLHAALPKKLRNGMLLVGSLLFFYWGEQVYTLLMLFSIGANWAFGGWVHRVRERPDAAKRVIACAVIVNLALLGFFKYADFVGENLSALLMWSNLRDGPLPQPGALFGSSAFVREYVLTPSGGVRLPIGISFFTFQAMSYVIDVYRKEGEVQKNPFDFALYVTFFPQLIAGPIVRYRDVDQQIQHRHVDRAKFALGVRRFIVGLAKKALIGDTLALPADQIFGLAAPERSVELAWLGIVCYALHLYFDFSGYSDMAIGMGKMFGFDFLENFDYPFVSRSVTEFWRRWHISLSTWFRDYVYLPLGGNRKGTARTYFNLIAIFALCGMWHGAGWNYLVFGLFQGLFLVIERLFFENRLPDRGWWRHVYVLLVFVVTWVVFRAANMTEALEYIGALFGGAELANPARPLSMYANPLVITMLVVGIAASIPWAPALGRAKGRWCERGERTALVAWLDWGGTIGLLTVFVISAMQITASTYSPFVYFRF
jgi:alginate O-acetyltransferase complex protein AlgI